MSCAGYFQMHLDAKKAKKPYDKVCCEACWFAKGDRCKCRCGGLYHGLGRGEKSLIDFALMPEISEKIMKQIKDKRCRWCGADLSRERIRSYDHSGGWKVTGFKELQWLYIVCPSCQYQWALQKLGVLRSAEF